MKRDMPRDDDLELRLRCWLRGHDTLITTREARAIGATAKNVTAKLKRGEWQVVFRGVYRDGASPGTARQTLLAACLASGPDAVASHRSAAWLWGLIDESPPTPELTLPAGDQHGRRRRGVATHQSADLDRRRTVIRRGVPCTDPLRTLLDLGIAAPAGALTDAVDRALATRLVTVRGLVAEVGRVGRRGRAGSGPLRQVLTDRGFVGAPHPSVLESKSQRMFRRQRLPVPVFELVTGPEGEYRLDTGYPAIGLAIEFDGYVWHFSPEHLQRDHARRNRLQADGWRILVYTWRDVVREPARVGREIATLHANLSAASPL
jgi:very-short-patch-repair endonuclease